VTSYSQLKSELISDAVPTTELKATVNDLSTSGNKVGAQAFVSETNRLYMWNGSGWYNIALINTTPTWDSNGQPNASYILDADSPQTATTITLAASDPEGTPVSYNYVTGGQMDSIATISQDSSVFTITPKTLVQAPGGGTGSITFRATDGINILPQVSSFTLNFITTIENSRYTTLLATPIANSTVYRYFKFLPQEIRGISSGMQYSEFELTDGSSYYSPTSAQQLYRSNDSDGDDWTASENVASSIDGDISTKVFNGGYASKYYLYDMGSSFNTVLTGWRYKTANDNDVRDPVSWTLLGSTNNTDWVLLDQRVNETIPSSRGTATQDFTFNTNNQAFLNAANTNYPIEVNGDAHAGTFSPYRSGGYSTYFDGSGDYLTTTGTAIGTEDFTLEAWIYTASFSNYRTIFTNRGSSNSTGNFVLGVDSAAQVYLYSNNFLITSSSTLSANTWHHVALVRNGTGSGSTVLYIDGSSVGSADVSNNFSDTAYDIGGDTVDSYHWNGYISDLRVNIGTAIYVSAFTPPTERLTAVTNTKLLTCHLPYIADGSTNDHSITVNGDPETKPFSPYDYLEYSATDHGGSVYFDGSGDYLQTANPLSLSGDFTVSAWVYPEGASKVQVIASPNLSPNNQFFIDANNFMGTYDGNSTHNALGFSVKRNAWNYLVWSRSGSSLNMYLNGEQSSNSPAVTNTYNLQYIGILQGANGPMQGYISDLQVKTTSTSAANAAPPTAPPSSSGSEIHIKGTDASVIDKSQGSNLKLIGNTTGSTTQVKFADTKSMYFDGSGDEINAGRSIIPVGFSDFTVEGWVNFSNVSGQQFICIQAPNGTTTTTTFMIYLANSKIYNQWGSGSAYIETGILSANTWYHFASVHDSANSLVYFYLDGSSVGSFSSGLKSIGDYVFDIGARDSALFLNGYLQDLRVSSYARYTTNFTPPTEPLEG
jgi:hypothetical protein